MGMTIEELLKDKYKLRIPPTVYYELLADVQEVEEEQEPTTRNCVGCKYSKDNHIAGTEECHLCMWENQYTSTTKNDLGVDYISRVDALRVAKNEYLRGWHNALCKALSEKYSIHCEEGNFSVIQEETITGLGLSMSCALGKDVESFMSTMPSVTPQEPKTGHWEYGYAFPDGQYCRCSECEELIKCIYPMHYCPNCGAKMAESEG